MPTPTTSSFFNSTTPAAPAGDQNVKPQTDGATPLQSISFYPKRMVGDTGSGGLAGTVPPPVAGDAAANKFLKADGTWEPVITALTGDVTTSDSGSTAATLAASGVAAGSYTNANITVDSKGRLTAAANGSGGSGGVSSLNSLSGALSIVAGSNVTVTPSGSSITIAASGSGSGGRGLFTGLMSATPTAAGIGITTNYNQSSTFSASNVPHGILFQETATENNRFEGLLGAYPSTPCTVTALMSLPMPTANYSCAGIVIATSPTGQASLFSLLNYGTAPYFVIYNNSVPGTNVSNSLFSQTGVNAALPWVWLRIKDDGVNITFYCSYDGYFFTQLYTSTKAAFYLGASGFKYLGFAIDNNGAPTISAVLQSWTITNP